MEQIDMFYQDQPQQTTTRAEYYNPHISEEDRLRQWRYVQAAFGGGPAGSPIRVEKMPKDITNIHEFIIVPNEKQRKEMNELMGDPEDPSDQKYLTMLYTYTTKVGMMVRSFQELAERGGPMGCLNVFTTTNIYESRLLVFWNKNPLEDQEEYTQWLDHIRGNFNKKSRRFYEISSERELYSA
ncbi:hypothetical protein pEaSNUABM13_00314 [Erwinia phage pEa_SNUABM_13]|nr:hypothetical protein pEaSNUABM13_00314 [Erwinia phage pEa_SNUABM_13]QYW03955.1 hypothetical protein pEaSNUABM45_00312 [Erwinia phage pEa_SNUABM_45]QYW04296.1 hypothetical protein pEaSNUABM46_00312 [Erwinia phage pEa_SNUABM_46]